MQTLGEWSYGPFHTTVKVTDDVRNFFETTEQRINLIDKINPDEWYQGWLLKHLDKNKDGIPDEEFGKEFELIYCGIIENPEDFVDVDLIIEDLGVLKEKVVFDGSSEVPDDNIDETKTRLWVRWVVLKTN